MAVNYNKAKELFNKGYTVLEIAKKLKCNSGTLNNNAKKWRIKNIEVEKEEKIKVSPEEPTNEIEVFETVGTTEIISETTEKEILKVKNEYKRQMQTVRKKIKDLLNEPFHEETLKELSLLHKLIDIIGKSQKVDWAVYDILEHKDLIGFELAVKKLEIEITKGR